MPILPGSGTQQEPRGPITWLRQYFHQARRSLRGPLGIIFVAGVIVLVYARSNHVDPAAYLKEVKSYVPTSIINVISSGPPSDTLRWDDDVDPKHGSNDILKRPKFHLLIPHKKQADVQICKTILTAAVLNYPPPTLISGVGSGLGAQGSELTKGVFDYLKGKEVEDDDLVIVAEEDTWFQLPSDVAINRFFHGMRDSNALLIEKYGFRAEDPGRSPIATTPKYTQKVLFGAQKECAPNVVDDPACKYSPASPLPNNIYGKDTDKQSKYNRPRFMHAPVVMGRVADLRPIFEAASEALESASKGQFGNQYVFAQIFGEQEFQRAASPKIINGASAKWYKWFAQATGGKLESTHDLPFAKENNLTTTRDRDYEFGIGLDYASSTFQVMGNSEADVQFVFFDHDSVIASPSKKSRKNFKAPIRLPPDLNSTSPPFSQHKVQGVNPNLPIVSELDVIPYWNKWTDVKLATNVIVPGGSVPASLNFHGNEKLMNQLWDMMWFRNASRTLLRQVHLSPQGHIASEAADESGQSWWDLRGGKGGVWTDRGEWLEWTDICGEHHEAIFGDHKGEFGKEFASAHRQPVYSKSGILLSGKPKPGQEGPEPGQVRIERLPRYPERQRMEMKDKHGQQIEANREEDLEEERAGRMGVYGSGGDDDDDE